MRRTVTTLVTLALLVAFAVPAFADDYGSGAAPAPNNASNPSARAAGSATSATNGYYLDGRFYASGSGPLANANTTTYANTTSYATTGTPTYPMNAYAAPSPAYGYGGATAYGGRGYAGPSYWCASSMSSYDHAPHGDVAMPMYGAAPATAYAASYTAPTYGNSSYGYNSCCCRRGPFGLW